MPRYQYACTVPECGHEFEAVQSFSDDALTSCPACDGRLRKVFGTVGVVFKGSGFYRTDSRADSHGRSDGDRSGAAEKGGAEKGGADKGGADKGSGRKGGGADASSATKSAGSGEKASTGSPKAAAVGA